METTRPARDDDKPACIDLLTRALTETRSKRGGAALIGDATPEAVLQHWMRESSEPSVLYVGEFHGVVVGLAAATLTVRAGAAEPSGYIECCYVEEEARGVGVGTALMTAIVAWCAEKDCRDIDALALPGDRLSKQRLEAAGFTARLLVLNRQLS